MSRFFELFIIVLLFQVYGVQCVSFPIPKGPYAVNIAARELIDTSRNNSGALQFFNLTTPRALMIFVFVPISSSRAYDCKDAAPISYFPAITAAFEDSEYEVADGTFESLTLPGLFRSYSTRPYRHPRTKHDKFPILVFSPGFGTTRLLYTSLASSIASYGYIVVTIDHPYDVDIVEFPDNSTVISPFLNTTNEETLIAEAPSAEAIRVADISFTLNQLANSSVVKGLNVGYTTEFDVSKVGIFGHPLGGASALLAMESDKRVSGAINLDGYIYGPAPSFIPTTGVSGPFVLFGGEGDNRNRCNNFFVDSWGSFWNESTGWKLELELTGAQHYDFSDLPLALKITNQTLGSDVEGLFQLGIIVA